MPVLRRQGRVPQRQLYDALHPLQGMWRKDKEQPQQGQSNRSMEQEGLVVGEYEVMPDERLKPCPFCGSSIAPHVTRYWDEGRHDYREFEWQVICNFNKGGCGSSSGVRGGEQEAIDLWNRGAR